MIGITLPLALIGAGFFIYLLFAAASYALPLFASLSAAFASAHAGVSGIAALLIGIAVFMATIMAARVAALTLPSRSLQIATMLLFAAPAAIAGFQVASALSQIGRISASVTVAASILALVVGSVAAKRLGVASQA